MSESEQKEPRILIANPNRFKPAPEPQEKLSDYQKKIRKDREKKQQEARKGKVSAIDEFNRQDIASVKDILNITPSKPVPILSESTFIYTPSEPNTSIMREEIKMSPPNSLNFNDEYDDMGFDLNEQLPEEKGGRRRKSRKLRKSSKKSRKPRRKTTRKVRRHRRRH
jgi:hypothetical protein